MGFKCILGVLFTSCVMFTKIITTQVYIFYVFKSHKFCDCSFTYQLVIGHPGDVIVQVVTTIEYFVLIYPFVGHNLCQKGE